MKGHQHRYLVFSHVFILLLFISFLPTESLIGLDRIAITFVMTLLISYGITLNWNQSATIALVFVLLVGLLDNRGLYSDWNQLLKENFDEDIKPAGDEYGDIPDASTEEKDETNLMVEDLDNILRADEENEKRGDFAQKKLFNEAGGGLDGLSKLLSSARNESIDSREKGADDHTPAEAQRKTHQLIDTMKQLKETMTEMMPVMKQSTQVMDLYKKLGGKDMMKAFS